MDSNTLSKYRLFGKAGKIVTTVLAAVCLLITLCCCAAAGFVAALPENALTVNVVEHTTLRFDAESFEKLWNVLGGSFSYSSETMPDYFKQSGGKDTTPPDNEQFQAKLELFDRSYDSAQFHTGKDEKVMQAEASPAQYSAKDLVRVFAFAALLAASATLALWLLRRLFAALTKCESPFCDEIVSRMRSFAYSLLPLAIFASISETVTESFLSAGKSGFSVQWGVLIAFVVTLALVAVFKYGVWLQTQSDETL